MGIFEAILLGVIQGLTEFLPVSSDGHLAMAQILLERAGFGLPSPDSAEMLMYDLVVHVGTLTSIFVVFRRDAWRFAAGLLARDRMTWKFALLGAAGTVATAAVAYPVKDIVQEQFARPAVVGVCWIVTGAFLFAATRVRVGRRGIGGFGFGHAILIGLMQAAAIRPGLSRSGTTISTALLLGLERQLAARFSFFLAVPAILGATAGETRDLLAEGLQPDWVPLGVGCVTAAVVGFVGLSCLLEVIRRLKLNWFAYYCWAVAALTLAAVAGGWL
jgi:undecaprenyl-diphosphatase